MKTIAVGTATSQHGALDRDGRLPSSSDTVLRPSHVDTLAQAIRHKRDRKVKRNQQWPTK